MLMNFIRWFKGSLEDDTGTASFRRIYNWIIIVLVAFLVIYATLNHSWTMLLVYVLIVLLVAGFMNTSVITADNVLRFFNRDKDTGTTEQQPPATPQKVNIEVPATISEPKP